MQTVYEAAGREEGLLRLACAWHERVMADVIVSHAFSYGFHPEHSERLAAYRSYGCTAATDHTRRWTAARVPASTRP